MKRLSAFAVLLAFLACNSTFAEEPGPNYEHLKPMEWVVGEWVLETKLPADVPEVGRKGDLVKVNVTYEWGLNKNVLTFRLTVHVNENLLNDVISTTGWDAEKSKIVSYGFHQDGGRSEGVLTITGPKAYKMDFRAVSKDGEPEEATLVVKQIDKNTLTLQMGDEPAQEYKRKEK